MNLRELNERFAIAGLLQFERGQGNLTRMHINSDTCEAVLYLHGAHLTHWQPHAHHPVLFTSHRSDYALDRPIRGGVPIVFPWFGPHAHDRDAPMHGLARQREWRIAHTEPCDDAVTITLELDLEEHTSPHWRYPCTLRLVAVIGAELDMALEVRSRANEAFTFEAGLHTYLAVANIEQVRVSGLEGTRYIDKVDGFKIKRSGDEAFRITGETDRVYMDTDATCVIDDPVLERRITVTKRDSLSTVVWNPWRDKAVALRDLGDDEWRLMLCIETANIGENAITLAPGATHAMACHLAVAGTV